MLDAGVPSFRADYGMLLSRLVTPGPTSPAMDIRTLHERPEELAAFVTTTWRSDYGGRMITPLWSPAFFDWQLQMSTDAGRRHLLGAYDGERLVGTLLGVPLRLLVDGERRGGLLSSWLTIASEARGAGLVPRLKQEQARRVQEEGGEVILSYRYLGSRDSLADRPSRGAGEQVDHDVRKVGTWLRLLDPRGAVEWSFHRSDRVMTRLGAPFLCSLKSKESSITVRQVTAGDIEACVALLRRANAGATLAIDWDADSLRQHLLGGGVARGLVACRGEEIAGLVSYHVLPYLARTERLLAVIDLLVVDELSWRQQVRFLKECLGRMQQEGAIMAVKMGLGDLPVATMLEVGFIPRSRDSLQVLRWLTPAARTSLRGRQLVLWR